MYIHIHIGDQSVIWSGTAAGAAERAQIVLGNICNRWSKRRWFYVYVILVTHSYVSLIHMCHSFICVTHSYVSLIHICHSFICVTHSYVSLIHMCHSFICVTHSYAWTTCSIGEMSHVPCLSMSIFICYKCCTIIHMRHITHWYMCIVSYDLGSICNCHQKDGDYIHPPYVLNKW